MKLIKLFSVTAMAFAGRGGNSDHHALRACRADNCSDVCPDEGGNGRHGRNRGGPPNEECFSCMQASCEIPQDILDRRDCVMNTCSAQCSADHSRLVKFMKSILWTISYGSYPIDQNPQTRLRLNFNQR